jgi:hypothetical protein
MNPGGDEQARVRVAKVVESDLRQAGQRHVALEGAVNVVRIDGSACPGQQDVIVFAIARGWDPERVHGAGGQVHRAAGMQGRERGLPHNVPIAVTNPAEAAAEPSVRGEQRFFQQILNPFRNLQHLVEELGFEYLLPDKALPTAPRSPGFRAVVVDVMMLPIVSLMILVLLLRSDHRPALAAQKKAAVGEGIIGKS